MAAGHRDNGPRSDLSQAPCGRVGKRGSGNMAAVSGGKNEPVEITDPWNMKHGIMDELGWARGWGSYVHTFIPAPGRRAVAGAEVLTGSKRRRGRVAGQLPVVIANFVPRPRKNDFFQVRADYG